jgi:ATP-binding cassette subfamily F protein 2
MAPISASKLKRQAEKAAKASKAGTPVSSKAGTPLTNVSAAGSQEDLTMAKLRLDTDRSGNGVLTSDSQSRDVHIDSYSLSFHGRLLIENATFSLNYGQR